MHGKPFPTQGSHNSNRNWKKRKRNLVRNYLGSSWQNCYTVGKKESTKEKGKRGRTRTGVNGKIPWNKET